MSLQTWKLKRMGAIITEQVLSLQLVGPQNRNNTLYFCSDRCSQEGPIPSVPQVNADLLTDVCVHVTIYSREVLDLAVWRFITSTVLCTELGTATVSDICNHSKKV